MAYLTKSKVIANSPFAGELWDKREVYEVCVSIDNERMPFYKSSLITWRNEKFQATATFIAKFNDAELTEYDASCGLMGIYDLEIGDLREFWKLMQDMAIIGGVI